MLSSLHFTRTISLGAIALLFAGCASVEPPAEPAPEPAAPVVPPAPKEPPARQQSNVDATVNVSRNANGGFDFRYQGGDVTPKGNMDLTGGKLKGKDVLIKFCLDDASYNDGVRFLPKSKDDAAIWIALSEMLPPGESPRGPYQGDQFVGFSTIKNGRCTQVVDKNDDGLVYTYALRFRVPGEKDPVQHDPIIRNGY